MATCLLGLGSNLGDREATLEAALAEIHALPDVQVRRHSAWQRSRSVGGPDDQPEFLNGAAVIETTIAPLVLLEELQRIETRHGRERGERWAARTLDIDVLLYDLEVLETAMITVPHPRLTFRRFVLEPATEVAAKMIHPVIGWPVARLLLHLDKASDMVTIVSPSEEERRALADSVVAEFSGEVIAPAELGTAAQLWPEAWTSWVRWQLPQPVEQLKVSPGGLPYAAAAFPKLTILLDAAAEAPRGTQSKWTPIVRRPGRGPSLRVSAADRTVCHAEVFAAIGAVWSDLGPKAGQRLK